MITIDGIPIQIGDRWKLSLQGLSSDEKPEKEFHGMVLANGSQFLEIDQMTLKMYDQENEKWV